jgi:RHS repeat-associated protein
MLDYYPFAKTLREYIYVRERHQTTYHERDEETGLDYRGARFYDSEVGRFLSVDPLTAARTWVSPYNYVQNNPILRVDPTGALDNPIYDTDGNFLGTDDRGLQGDAIAMDKRAFKQGMSHNEAKAFDNGTTSMGDEAKSKMDTHSSGLPSRPDYDGIVTRSEGIAWAKANPGALENPTADNMLYIDASKLDFGNISISDFTNGIGKSSPINLLNAGNLAASIGNETLRATVYALGRVDMQLNDKAGNVSIVNDFNKPSGRATDYDWNTGGGKLRNTLIRAERNMKGLNDSHGFRAYYYGSGTLNNP